MKESPHYFGHRQRLRERFLEQGSGMPDYELLELLLSYGLPRKDTKPLAKELLDRFGNLKGVFAADSRELREVSGFGPGLETFWEVLRELWKRLGQQGLEPKAKLDSPQRVAEAARRRLGYDSVERLWAALLDNKNRLISFRELGSGTVDQIHVHPRQVLTLALEYKASAVILAHNHPGGDPTPSAHDLELTRRTQRAGTEIGIRVLDHVIVAEESYCSLYGQGYISAPD